jgi:hypothetical protein
MVMTMRTKYLYILENQRPRHGITVQRNGVRNDKILDDAGYRCRSDARSSFNGEDR